MLRSEKLIHKSSDKNINQKKYLMMMDYNPKGKLLLNFNQLLCNAWMAKKRLKCILQLEIKLQPQFKHKTFTKIKLLFSHQLLIQLQLRYHLQVQSYIDEETSSEDNCLILANPLHHQENNQLHLEEEASNQGIKKLHLQTKAHN